MTPASLRRLLEGAIDYAGTFPPAALSLEAAATNYLRYRQQPESWMLARIICPAAQLAELASLVERQSTKASARAKTNEPVAVSVILSGGATSDAWRQNVQRDLQSAIQLSEVFKIEAFETRMPACGAGQGSGAELAELLDGAGELKGAGAPLFLELPSESLRSWRAAIERMASSLAEFSQRPAPGAGWSVGFKLRTGGTTPEAFLSCEQLAAAICTLRDRQVRWKATAGLHHPLPRSDEKLGVRMHGFVNILAAAVLADAVRLSPAEVQAVLETDDPGGFRFEQDALRWRDVSVDIGQIALARRRSLASFGSCSFDEPRDDLRLLSWL